MTETAPCASGLRSLWTLPLYLLSPRWLGFDALPSLEGFVCRFYSQGTNRCHVQCYNGHTTAIEPPN